MTISYKYVIIGGGMAADAAARGIRQLDEHQSILMFSTEQYEPYNRPPLSKGLWGKTPLNRIYRKTSDLGIDIRLNCSIHSINPTQQVVFDDQGKPYQYEKLLIATGADPIHLPSDNSEIIYYRTLMDYHKLRSLADQKNRFVVIGGGYIGSEIAASLSANGKQVSMIFPEAGICARTFPSDLSLKTNQLFEEHGVKVLTSRFVKQVISNTAETLVITNRGETLSTDGVVAGLGVRPNVALAQSIGLKIGRGIMVDSHLETSQPGIFAAGDCIDFFTPILNRVIWAEHEEHANQSGQCAGRIMAGSDETYTFLPSAYSDLFDFGYESIGILDSRLQMVSDWIEPYKKGAVYTLQDHHVVGILFINMAGRLEQARQVLAAKEVVRPKDLIGRILPKES